MPVVITHSGVRRRVWHTDSTDHDATTHHIVAAEGTQCEADDNDPSRQVVEVCQPRTAQVVFPRSRRASDSCWISTVGPRHELSSGTGMMTESRTYRGSSLTPGKLPEADRLPRGISVAMSGSLECRNHQVRPLM